MNGRAFKLGTFAKPDGKPFTAIVLDDTAIDLAQAAAASRFGRKTLTTEADTRTRASRTCSTAGTPISPRCRRSSPSSTRTARAPAPRP